MEHASSATASLAPRVLHVAPGAGKAVWVVGDTFTFKATSSDTAGSLVVWEATVPPSAGPPPHLHRSEDEAYYVLAG